MTAERGERTDSASEMLVYLVLEHLHICFFYVF